MEWNDLLEKSHSATAACSRNVNGESRSRLPTKIVIEINMKYFGKRLKRILVCCDYLRSFRSLTELQIDSSAEDRTFDPLCSFKLVERPRRIKVRICRPQEKGWHFLVCKISCLPKYFYQIWFDWSEQFQLNHVPDWYSCFILRSLWWSRRSSLIWSILVLKSILLVLLMFIVALPTDFQSTIEELKILDSRL